MVSKDRVNVARDMVKGEKILAPVRRALNTIEKHRESNESRWISEHSSARIEALNGIFQTAKARTRRFRQDDHQYDLPCGFTGARYPEIHMKRRRAAFSS